LSTIEAHLKTNDTAELLPIENEVINGYFMNLEDNDFNMDKIYKQLLDEGLVAFEESFNDMLEQIK